MEKEHMKYKIDQSAPLNPEDTATQTFGCRCYNPDICKYYTDDSCALSNKSHICTTPSRKWKKIYEELKNNKNS